MSKRDTFCWACLCPLIKVRSYKIADSRNFQKKLMQCIPLDTIQWDECPHSMCPECYKKVLDFYEFQQMCYRSLEKYKSCLEIRCEYDVENKEESVVAEGMKIELLSLKCP